MLIIRCKKNKGLFLSIAVTVRTILLISFFGACACSEDVSLCQCTQLEEDFIELRKEFEDFIKTLNLSKPVSVVDKPKPKSCEDVDGDSKTSGVYEIYPFSDEEVVKVYCDFDTDGGDWIVVQRRMDGSEDFFRSWNDYVSGFGDLNGEFWLGLELLHRLTTKHKYELRFDMEDFEENEGYAAYRSFAVGKGTNYTITTLGEYSGSAGDHMSGEGSRFSTKDRDQDNSSKSCAKTYKGGWWYDRCHKGNPNGLYHGGAHQSFADGVNWLDFRGFYYSLKYMEMKIRKA